MEERVEQTAAGAGGRKAPHQALNKRARVARYGEIHLVVVSETAVWPGGHCEGWWVRVWPQGEPQKSEGRRIKQGSREQAEKGVIREYLRGLVLPADAAATDAVRAALAAGGLELVGADNTTRTLRVRLPDGSQAFVRVQALRRGLDYATGDKDDGLPVLEPADAAVE